MIADSLLRLPGATRPGSFAALMTLYESNYVRLSWLFDIDSLLPASAVSADADDISLYMDVLERARYTTTLRLTYFFDEKGEQIADPDLHIRIYHDAKMVEARACTRRHRHEALRCFETGPGAELARRWGRNVMLNKWLEYCIDKGHRFPQKISSLAMIPNS
jgi:uncharacterized protein YqiB (DUF1249 family)